MKRHKLLLMPKGVILPEYKGGIFRRSKRTKLWIKVKHKTK
jgi:hypothetical protein